MKIPFEKEESSLFGFIYRPYYPVSFWSGKYQAWVEIIMIVDSGADYTLLPKHWAEELGINLKLETSPLKTGGVGGDAKVHLLKKQYKAKINSWERNIPLGILDNDEVPPLLGRHGFMETFKVVFDRRNTEFNGSI